MVRNFDTHEAMQQDLEAIRALLDRAFAGGFTETDWEHSLGGRHVAAIEDGAIVAHASVVHRRLDVGDSRFDTGYVEAVATEPARQGFGLGTALMRQVADLITAHNEFGALSTGEHHFYERLGWERWRGPTFVRDGDELIRTPDEDDGIMVLRFGPSAGLDLHAPICCDARSGDDW